MLDMRIQIALGLLNYLLFHLFFYPNSFLIVFEIFRKKYAITPIFPPRLQYTR